MSARASLSGGLVYGNAALRRRLSPSSGVKKCHASFHLHREAAQYCDCHAQELDTALKESARSYVVRRQ